MEDSEVKNPADPGQSVPGRDTRDGGTQTDSRIQGHDPRLSNENLFTLLSLWMELFPQGQSEEDDHGEIRGTGLVVVRDGKVAGLHCSGPELHAGQAAILQHGACLADCQLYFSRRPCASCLKMIINAGVSEISFWPGDPEVSMLRPGAEDRSSSRGRISEEAALDAVATEKLKSNSRPHICVLLQPLAPGLAQFVDETSRGSDFLERMSDDEPGLNTDELFNGERTRHLKAFSRRLLMQTPEQHREILTHMGLENFCVEPSFSNLRHNMRQLVEVLAAVAAGVPQQHYGFHREQHSTPEPSESPLPARQEELSQEVARHCIIQAKLLSYRTEDPKVGVGAVIWAKAPSAASNGTGHLCLVGCGYNAYPAGSHYAEYPRMDTKQEDRQRRKYRYIVHAEQNALTFRTRPIKPEEPAALFVTKCPCDECVPLIRGAGIAHIYTCDQDRDKDKGDISYLRFGGLRSIGKFVWRRSPAVVPASPPRHANGCTGKRGGPAERESRGTRKRRADRSNDSQEVG
ncbi:cytidine and dCMP deaminase domain-containing protein 1 [Pungitius pungitius]|uniref:cytidine and dCMP deaminase domain-containing protein 1 n=1 Tax=Pungitius pungitius TaxID=134920 RepID=UPI002E1639B5